MQPSAIRPLFGETDLQLSVSGMQHSLKRPFQLNPASQTVITPLHQPWSSTVFYQTMITYRIITEDDAAIFAPFNS
jgi:hypothetical protein